MVLLGTVALLLVPATAPAQMLRNYQFGGFRGGYYGYSPGFYYGTMPGSYGYGGYYSPYSWNYPPGYTTYGSGSYPNYARGNYNWGGYTYPNSAATDFYYNTPSMGSSYGAGYPYDMGSSYAYGARAGGTRDAAVLNVRLPDANAEVFVDGKATRQRGTWREFESPPLDPAKSYSYEVRAVWTENGKQVERTKTVPVKANGVATVDFTPAASNSRVDEIDRDRRGTDIDRERRGTDTDRARPKGDTNPRPGSGTKPPDTGTRPPDTDRPPDKQ
jgi:uncharacterized protein (TIGR03000 family)